MTTPFECLLHSSMNMYLPFVLGPEQARDVRTWPASLQSQVLSFLAPPELGAWSAASVVQHPRTLGRLAFQGCTSPLQPVFTNSQTAGLCCWHMSSLTEG